MTHSKLPIEFLTSKRKEGKWWHVLRTGFLSFDEAFEFCKQNNMKLPVPNNDEENDAFGRIPGGNFYLGMRFK